MSAAPQPVGNWAKASLVMALAVAVLGLFLERSGAGFAGGLLLAFGEASLVGGLADWFAVRALFTHPFGIPFPHSALIPRNRRRIVAEIRSLVEHEWLARPALVARIEGYDFVEGVLLPFAHAQRGALNEVVRTAARSVLADVSPAQVSGFLSRAAAGALENDQVVPFVARLLARAREEHWLEPVVHTWLSRLEDWAASEESYALLLGHLERAAEAYRTKGWFKNFTYQMAESLGGLDLPTAASLLQNEIKRFAAEQGASDGPVQRAVGEGLANVERRLVEDPDFVRGLRDFLAESSAGGTLPNLFGPVIESIRARGLAELDSPGSPLPGWVVDRLGAWLLEVEHDAEMRGQVNAWCRQLAVTLVERHHPIIGLVVEEQLNRLTDENLVELIEDKVGEDLNWIRINGALVGGAVGVALYLLFRLLEGAFPQ